MKQIVQFGNSTIGTDESGYTYLLVLDCDSEEGRWVPIPIVVPENVCKEENCCLNTESITKTGLINEL
jgi:hypothetical protein